MPATSKYFKLTTTTEEDRVQLIHILESKIFYPDLSSKPASLPAVGATSKHNANSAIGQINVGVIGSTNGSFNIKAGPNIINDKPITFGSKDSYADVANRIEESINAYTTHTTRGVDGSITIRSNRKNADQNVELILEIITGDALNAETVNFTGGTVFYESYDFDFRQFFKYIYTDTDGMPLVKTRQDYKEVDWDTSIVPDIDWVNKYNILDGVTVSIFDYNEIDSVGHGTNTNGDIFLSYEYPPLNLFFVPIAPEAPITTTVSSAYGGTAYSGGTLNFDGGSAITACGVVWSTNPNPTLDDTVVNSFDDLDGDTFVSHLIDVSYTTIYVRAFATNAIGTTYGNELSFVEVICLVKGTKITMSDMSTKNIEDITYDDDVLTWNFDCGKYESSKLLWIKTPEITSISNKLIFSDNTELSTVGQHRIFNVKNGKFTYPMTDDTPIGTTTFNVDGNYVTLMDKYTEEAVVEYYNIISTRNINVFANGILTSNRYNNIYPIADMKFIKDDRVLRPRSEFINIEDKYIDGLRLTEQPMDIDNIENYVNRLKKYEIQLELA